MRYVLLIASVASGAACSAWVDFDPEDQVCTPEGRCLDGYDCLGQRCVAFGSRTAGQTCRVNRTCADDLICPAPGFACAALCDRPFFDGQCSNTADPNPLACRRVTDSDEVFTAACVRPDCTNTCEDALGRTRICVKVNTSAGFCLDRCSVTCTAGTCTGDCPDEPSPSNSPQSCQFLGAETTPACITSDADATHGTLCDNIERVCASGHACALPPQGGTGVCLSYCDPGTPSACSALNDPVTGAPAPTGCTAYPASTTTTLGVCGTLPTQSLE